MESFRTARAPDEISHSVQKSLVQKVTATGCLLLFAGLIFVISVTGFAVWTVSSAESQFDRGYVEKFIPEIERIRADQRAGKLPWFFTPSSKPVVGETPISGTLPGFKPVPIRLSLEAARWSNRGVAYRSADQNGQLIVFFPADSERMDRSRLGLESEEFVSGYLYCEAPESLGKQKGGWAALGTMIPNAAPVNLRAISGFGGHWFTVLPIGDIYD